MHERRTQEPDAHAGRTNDRQPWSILILLCVAQFMVILDITVVNVALPSIGEALDFVPADLQWVVTAYVLFTGGLLLLGGRAADLFGRRRIFLTGLWIFTAASLASGLATSPEVLIAARASQGLGAALLTPGALSIITTTYVDAQRAAALSAWGAIGSAGAAAGVVLGGMLTTWLGWEWIFFINVPVGLATAFLALRLVPAKPPAAEGHGQLDPPARSRRSPGWCCWSMRSRERASTAGDRRVRSSCSRSPAPCLPRSSPSSDGRLARWCHRPRGGSARLCPGWA